MRRCTDYFAGDFAAISALRAAAGAAVALRNAPAGAVRAATYFAHGGSSSQSPLHSVSAWRRKLRSFPCSSSSRRTRFAGLRRE